MEMSYNVAALYLHPTKLTIWVSTITLNYSSSYTEVSSVPINCKKESTSGSKSIENARKLSILVTLSPPTHSVVATIFWIKYPAQWNNSHFLSYLIQWWPYFITSPQYPIVITLPSILTPSGCDCPTCQNGGFQSADGSFGEGEICILGPKISHLGFYASFVLWLVKTWLQADLQVRSAAGSLSEDNQT